MSKSVKIKARLTDQKDRSYLALLGTSFHQQKMEAARVRVERFELPEFKSLEASTPFPIPIPDLYREDAGEGFSTFTPGISREQRQALEHLGDVLKSSGYRPNLKALPSSTGGIVIDLVKDKRGKVYVRRETRDEQDFHRKGRDPDLQ